jgi:hypothetical protein
MNRLSEVITGKGIPFGSTLDGKAFATKVLHPADPICECKGVPDGGSRPTVMLNFNSNSVIAPPIPIADADTWNMDCIIIQHPVYRGYCQTYATSTPGTYNTVFFDNPQIPQISGTVDANNRQDSFIQNVAEYRMVYGGVTGVWDAPKLANQGTIITAQYPLRNRKVSVSLDGSVGHDAKRVREEELPDKVRTQIESLRNARYASGYEPKEDIRDDIDKKKQFGAYVGPPYADTAYSLAQVWSEFPRDFDSLFNMPSACMSVAELGFYAPFKVDDEMKWKKTFDIYAYIGMVYGTYLFSNASTFHVNGTAQALNTALNLMPPVPSELPYGLKTMGPLAPGGYGNLIIDRCSENIIHISGRNLSRQGRFFLYLRFGFQCRVFPGSIYSPMQITPPELDHEALDCVRRIQRQLKDGYPADYNDWGKLFGVIKEAANQIGPFLGPFGAVARAVGGAAGLAESIVSRGVAKSKTSKRDIPTQSAIDNARQRMTIANIRPQPQRKRSVILRNKKGFASSMDKLIRDVSRVSVNAKPQRKTRRSRRGGRTKN